MPNFHTQYDTGCEMVLRSVTNKAINAGKPVAHKMKEKAGALEPCKFCWVGSNCNIVGMHGQQSSREGSKGYGSPTILGKSEPAV